jgi:hypothetical protein
MLIIGFPIDREMLLGQNPTDASRPRAVITPSSEENPRTLESARIPAICNTGYTENSTKEGHDYGKGASEEHV